MEPNWLRYFQPQYDQFEGSDFPEAKLLPNIISDQEFYWHSPDEQ
jgi:hypothetical protein